MTQWDPQPDAESAPFWEALGEGRLLLVWCRACEEPFYYPRAICPRCWSTVLEWRPATGHGTVFTYTTIRQAGPPFASLVPYNVSLVELDEGPRLTTNIVNVDPDDVRIGMEVVIAPQCRGSIWLPTFEPAD
jgi:uncharacterized OB-fold protein